MRDVPQSHDVEIMFAGMLDLSGHYHENNYIYTDTFNFLFHDSIAV